MILSHTTRLSGVRFLACLALLFLLPACADKAPDTRPAEQIFSEINHDLDIREKGTWFQAWGADTTEDIRRKFSRLRLDHPFSRFAAEAELRTADSYYLDESWDEALAAYEGFSKNHPTHPRLAYARYRAAVCYKEQAPRVTFSFLRGDALSTDLDQQSTLSAYVTAREIEADYPGTEWAAKAGDLETQMADVLSRYEIYVGTYYLRFDHYEAAAGRFLAARERYPQSPHYGEASFKLGLAYERMGEPAKARTAYEGVLSLGPKNFPEKPDLRWIERSWAYFTAPEILRYDTGEQFWKGLAKDRIEGLGK